MHLKHLISCIFVCFLSSFLGQTGGLNSFAFLNLDYSARNASLAGTAISLQTDDINLAISNPSLLNSEMHKKIAFNHAILSGGINYGMVSFGHQLKKGTIAGSLKYNDYGKMSMTESNGIAIGEFRPFEYILGLSYGYQLNPNISVGASVNLIGSHLESYSAFGASIDLAGTYMHVNKLFSVSAIFKNAGFKFKDYTSNDSGILPADMQLALSYKLKHAPFRFSMLIHKLNQWNLDYVDPNAQPTYDPLTGNLIPVPTISFIENLARHFAFSAELNMSKNIHLRMGLNYLRRQELKLTDRPGMSGFTLGAGFNFSKIRIDYAFTIYSKAGFNNLLSISTPLDKWRKEKKIRRIITTSAF